MWLLAGLGNPGNKYAGHRHNIGFMAVDAFADYQQFPSFSKKFSAEMSKGSVGTEQVLLLKPQTYMNESGRAVREAMDYFNIPLDKVIVLHDELDIAFGKVRIKKGGGAGGHNGLKSIDAHCGKDYWRVRLGIDHPGDRNRVTGYVLNDFSKEEQLFVSDLCDALARYLPMMWQDGHEALMSKLALVSPPPVATKASNA